MNTTFPVVARAVETTPTTILYEGRLLYKRATSPRITGFHVRFSLWNTSDWLSTDSINRGNINTASAGYGGWQEVHNINIDDEGLFKVRLGSNTPLPQVDVNDHLYLQVEVKKVGEPNNDYQLLDPTADKGVDTDDRQPLGAVFYAKNADRVDNKDVGTSSGNLAVLSSGGQWAKSQIPSGTVEDSFLLDSNNTITSAGAIKLQFGDTLNKYLEYSVDDAAFNMNDAVNITGKITGEDDVEIMGSLTIHQDLNVYGAQGLTGDFAVGGDLSVDQNIEVGAQLKFGTLLDKILEYSNLDNLFVFNDTLKVDGDLEVTGSITGATLDGDDLTFQDIPLTALTTRTKNIYISPKAFIISPDGSDNYADVTAGIESENTYYMVQSDEVTLQDVDLIAKVWLPGDLESLDSISLTYKNTGIDATDSKIDIAVVDMDGDNGYTPSSGQDLFSTIWTSFDQTFDGVDFDPMAGEYILITVKGYASEDGGYQSAYVGEISLSYTGR